MIHCIDIKPESEASDQIISFILWLYMAVVCRTDIKATLLKEALELRTSPELKSQPTFIERPPDFHQDTFNEGPSLLL